MLRRFYNGNVAKEPGAVVCRVAPSFVRFGTFQLAASREGVSGTGEKSEAGLVDTLLSYIIEKHYPGLAPVCEEGETPTDAPRLSYVSMLMELARRTASVIAHWQLFGFVHGVMNTDNMSILGLTIDYGPFSFLDAYDPSFTPNITDLQNRRYCYINQPSVGLWNLAQLLNALTTAEAIGEDDCAAILDEYRREVRQSYWRGVARKLGLSVEFGDGDDGHDFADEDSLVSLQGKLTELMHQTGADFTLTFRCLSRVDPSSDDDDGHIVALREAGCFTSVGDDLDSSALASWREWLSSYRTLSASMLERMVSSGRAATLEHARRLRGEVMDAHNPLYIPRNYILQECIEDAETRDFRRLEELLEVLESPFTERADGAPSAFGRSLTLPPPPHLQKKPGVSLLS